MQNATDSTCIGTSGSQLLDLRSDHTGDEYSAEYDELALADNLRDANTSTSSSVSVHRPEAAGHKRGTTYYTWFIGLIALCDRYSISWIPKQDPIERPGA